MKEIIVSKDNARYKMWLKLQTRKHRQKEGLFLVEGEHLVLEAEKAGLLETIICHEDYSGELASQGIFLKDALYRPLAQTITSAGVIGVTAAPQRAPQAYNRLLLIDGLQDPGNLGTLIRSALAFNFDGVVLGKGCVDPYNEKSIRASSGAIFHLPVVQEDLPELIPELKKKGVRVYGTALDARAVFPEAIVQTEKMAFIIGNEGGGVSDELLTITDQNIMLEMNPLAESLNAGIAGSVLMYLFKE